MLSRKPLGFVGAAMLGIMALLGTSTANAAIDLDADTTTAKYAQETITETLAGTGGGTYYIVNSGSENHLVVSADLGFGTTPRANLVVRYDFTGMILADDLASGALVLE